MIGLAGPQLRPEDVALFRDTRAAGLILYRRNFESPAQLTTLVSGLEAALGRRLLVATDHEGGRVIMMGGGVTVFPDNLAVGAAGEEAFAYRQGLIEARELRRLGVDLNLGPVLDVLTERYSPNIGIRSYGKDPALVARYGRLASGAWPRAGSPPAPSISRARAIHRSTRIWPSRASSPPGTRCTPSTSCPFTRRSRRACPA